MGKLNRVVNMLFSACLLLGACSERSAPAAEREVERARQASKAAAAAQPVDPRFDASGNLKSSGQRMSWLELPVGFTKRAGSTTQQATFEAQNMPFSKVREFLEARIVPGNIVYRANGTTFQGALPSHTRLDMPPMDVTILETDRKRGEIRLAIDDLTPPAAQPIKEENAALELAKARARAE
ncbi:MAG: hypothetical protein RLZZ450_4986 [Pseudomonadota bacterium]|jgi:hypothetical protein